MRKILLVALLPLLLPLSGTSLAASDKIPILVLVDTPAELRVDYRTGGRLARKLILLGGLLDLAIDSAVTGSDSDKLRAAVGSFARKPVVEAGVIGGFSVQQYFEASAANPEGAYGSAETPRLDRIRSAGFSHVLAIEEKFAGMITAWEMSTLSAGTSLSYRFLDAESGKVLAKDDVNGFGLKKYSYEDATGKRELFLSDYPQAVAAVVTRILGDLRKNGHLHRAALKHGMGDKVPDTSAVLAKYESRFSYKFARPSGWNAHDMNTKYVTVLAPEADKANYGLNVTFDLLLEEFGQRVQTVEDYARIFLKRASTAGYELVPEKFAALDLRGDYRVFTVENRGNGAVNVLLFRKLDENFVVIYSIVLLKDHDALFSRYKSGVESIINTASISTK